MALLPGVKEPDRYWKCLQSPEKESGHALLVRPPSNEEGKFHNWKIQVREGLY